ncbi:MAG: hypothetical protein ACRC0V_06855 [Fusobacteriaceae bacterium]
MEVTIGLIKNFEPENKSYEVNFWMAIEPQFDYDNTRDSGLDTIRTQSVKMIGYKDFQSFQNNEDFLYAEKIRIEYTYLTKPPYDIPASESLVFNLQNILYDNIVSQVEKFADSEKVIIEIPM